MCFPMLSMPKAMSATPRTFRPDETRSFSDILKCLYVDNVRNQRCEAFAGFPLLGVDEVKKALEEERTHYRWESSECYIEWGTCPNQNDKEDIAAGLSIQLLDKNSRWREIFNIPWDVLQHIDIKNRIHQFPLLRARWHGQSSDPSVMSHSPDDDAGQGSQ